LGWLAASFWDRPGRQELKHCKKRFWGNPMGDLWLWLNNFSSVALILTAWWLAHSMSLAGFPFGKVLSTLWALLGFSVLITMVARNIRLDPEPLLVISKVLLAAIAIAWSRRLAIRSKMQGAARS